MTRNHQIKCPGCNKLIEIDTETDSCPECGVGMSVSEHDIESKTAKEMAQTIVHNLEGIVMEVFEDLTEGCPETEGVIRMAGMIGLRLGIRAGLEMPPPIAALLLHHTEERIEEISK